MELPNLIALYPTVRDACLFALALYGAGLSTFNWRQAVKRERRTLLVKLKTAVPAYGNGTLGAPVAVVEVTNGGLRPVTVSTITIATKRGHIAPMRGSNLPFMSDTPLPITLKDGEAAVWHVAYGELLDALESAGLPPNTQLTPTAIDSVGSLYKGDTFDVGDWTREV